MQFRPAQYLIADDRIPAFESACPVRLVDGQPSTVRQMISTSGQGMEGGSTASSPAP